MSATGAGKIRMGNIGIYMLALALSGVVRGSTEPEPAAAPSAAENPSQEDAAAAKPRAFEGAGIENLFEIAPGVYSGGQPEGDAGFETLAKLGVTTILNVDGAQPDTDRASAHGMKYIHLPIGYDGIEAEMAMKMARAAQVTQGPVFIHCHHGKHRGPAAAALWCMTAAGWSNEQAVQWLKAAGTSASYLGLYAVARQFVRPSDEALAKIPATFPDHADTPPMVRAMVTVSYRWEHLKDIQAAGYKTPKDHPDLAPAHEALLLAEAYREMLRTDEVTSMDSDFVRLMQTAERNAWKLHAYLEKPAADDAAPYVAGANTLLKAIGNDCAACHDIYRNQ